MIEANSTKIPDFISKLGFLPFAILPIIHYIHDQYFYRYQSNIPFFYTRLYYKQIKHFIDFKTITHVQTKMSDSQDYSEDEYKDAAENWAEDKDEDETMDEETEDENETRDENEDETRVEDED